MLKHHNKRADEISVSWNFSIPFDPRLDDNWIPSEKLKGRAKSFKQGVKKR